LIKELFARLNPIPQRTKRIMHMHTALHLAGLGADANMMRAG
jgi:hypothetical protein